MSSEPTTLIIGAGIFGTSTAYHLSQRVPPGSITIVDRHALPAPLASSATPPVGASHDVSKIARADYTDAFYTALASEALESWRSDPLLQPWWHASGWVALHEAGSDVAVQSRRNLAAAASGGDRTRDVDIASELRSGWKGAFAGTNTEGVKHAYWNPDVGWVEADRAVDAMLRDAVGRGVVYRQGQVRGLVAVDAKQSVAGVVLEDGQVLRADRVLLAAGAWTSSVAVALEESLDLDLSQRVERQVKAAGVCVGHFNLTEADIERFADAPVLVHGSEGEMLPPHDTRLLKVNNATSFTNSIKSDGGSAITAPSNGSQFEVPARLKLETLEIARKMVGDVASEGNAAFFRLCWDAITPQQHQLMTRHPGLDNLFLAVGGSFHSWKFLPNIGKYVTNVIQGISNGEEKDTIWAWKQDAWGVSQQDGVHKYTVPKRELVDLMKE